MILLSVDEIINTHSKLISKTGGLDGLRDISLLESAVINANICFAGIEQYPSIEEKSCNYRKPRIYWWK